MPEVVSPTVAIAANILAADAAARATGEGSLVALVGPTVSGGAALPAGPLDGAESSVAGANPFSEGTLVADRRRCQEEALLHAQLTRERLGKMEAVLKSVEPTFERIPLYVEKLRMIRKTMHSIDENVRVMRKEANEIYASSGLEK